MSALSKRIKIIVKIRNPITQSKPEQKKTITNQSDSKKDQNQTKRNNTSQKPKSPGKLTPKSTNSNMSTTSKPSVNPNLKYSIFTSVQKSNLVVIADSPINVKLIQDTFQNYNDIYDYSLNLIKESTIMEFDHVYSDSTKSEQFYLEQIKEPISEMLTGKNSCVILFGTSESGKSYSLKGNNNEKGILEKSAEELLNFIEINKQVNQGKSNRSQQSFNLKMSVFSVFNEEILDILKGGKNENKGLKIEKFKDNTGGLSTYIVDLAEKEVFSKKDIIDTIETTNKIIQNQSQSIQMNDLCKKSTTVISLILEKIVKYTDPYTKSFESTTEKFSQIDFVELPSSEFGISANTSITNLPSNDPNAKITRTIESMVNKTVENSFESICENIVSASNGSETYKDSKLSLALKNTLNPSSNIVFICCVNPIENPPINGKKALKFTSWMRNRIHNLKENIQTIEKDDSNNFIEEDVYEKKKNWGIENETKNNNYDPDIIYKNTKIENFPRNKNENIAENRYQEDNKRNENVYEYPKSKIYSQKINPYLSRTNEFYSNSRSNSGENYDFRDQKYSPNPANEKKVDRLNFDYGNREKLESNFKSQTVTNFNDFKNQRKFEIPSREFELENENKTSLNFKSVSEAKEPKQMRSMNDNTSNYYEFNDIKQENMVLRSDLIIFKEENLRLTEINSNQKQEIEKLMIECNELKKENQNLVHDRISKQQEIEKLSLSKNNIFGIQNQTQSRSQTFDHISTLESKIKELENTNRTLLNEKQKFEVDYRVMCERYNEIKNSYDKIVNEMNIYKSKSNDEIEMIDQKLNKMCVEMELIQKENFSFRKNEDKLKNENDNLIKENRKYKEKYEKTKEMNKTLISKVNDFESNKIMRAEINNEKKEEERKIRQNSTKKQLLDEMKNKISNFKNSCIKNRIRSESEDDNLKFNY